MWDKIDSKLTQNCIFDNPTVTRGQLAMEPPQKSAWTLHHLEVVPTGYIFDANST